MYNTSMTNNNTKAKTVKKCARQIVEDVQMLIDLSSIASPTVIQLLVIKEMTDAGWFIDQGKIDHIIDHLKVT